MKIRYMLSWLLLVSYSSVVFAQSNPVPIYREVGYFSNEVFYHDDKGDQRMSINDLEPYRPNSASLDVEFRVQIYEEILGKEKPNPIIGAPNTTRYYLGKTIRYDGTVRYWFDVMFIREIMDEATIFLGVDEKLLRGLQLDSDAGLIEKTITIDDLQQFESEGYRRIDNGPRMYYKKRLDYLRLDLSEDQFFSLIYHHRFAVALSSYAKDFHENIVIIRGKDWLKLQKQLKKLQSITY